MTITVRRVLILHMGLPYWVAVDGAVLARFTRATNAIAWAQSCHNTLWGRDAELVIQEGLSP